MRKIHETGITIVIVEHIMEVIMTLAGRVLVFNQGHVIASGKPDDVVKNEAVIEAYLGRGHRTRRRIDVSDLAVEHLEVRYGDLVGVADVSLRRASRAASSRCSARTAPARPRRSTPLPAWCEPRSGRSHGAAKSIAGQPAYQIVGKGLALSPEGWRLFVSQTVEQNLRLGATALGRSGTDRDACSSGSIALFPRLPSGASSSPARCRAASGRCWRSAAR